MSAELSSSPRPIGDFLTSSPEYESMDEDLTAPHQCHVQNKEDRQSVVADRPQGCPDESTVDYEPMDEGIPAPQCPAQKKYNYRQPVVVDRPKEYPDEFTVEYESMDEDILRLQRTVPHENDPADPVPPQNHPTAAGEVSSVYESVDTDPPQDIPAKSPAVYAAIDSGILPQDITEPVECHIYNTVDSELSQNTSDEPHAVYNTVKADTQPVQDPPTGFSSTVYEQIGVGAPPDYDELIADNMQPHHQYQILHVPTTSPTEVQPAEQRNIKIGAKIVLIFAIIMLVLFGINLIFLPLIIPAIVVAALALKSTGGRQKKMVAIGAVLDILTCICFVVLSPGIVCAWILIILFL